MNGYNISEERLSAEDYINFLKRTNLGAQYPKERFQERISTLVQRASISLVARDDENDIIGVCFGLTDFAYWLFITDLGVVRGRTGQGVGRALGQASCLSLPAEARTLSCIPAQTKTPSPSMKRSA